MIEDDHQAVLVHLVRFTQRVMSVYVTAELD